MKISVIIPHYEVSLEKRKLLLRFLESIAGQYTELIIIAEKRENLASKINEGLKKASGDYIIVSNDDCQLIKG
ncbi:MAG: glycosyltransferase, partial [Candidatus Diapherotrites archaeon]|nr:glycosyltransferase [Candidatus Diapherotrites archaeon]